MPQFSSVFKQKDAEVRSALSRVACPSTERVHELFARSASEPLGLAELAELLEIGVAPEAGEQFELLRSLVLPRWRKPDQNQVRYVAPIYVSSYCLDTCPYCNFAATRKGTTRKRLGPEELDREIEDVMARGIRVIELVYATDPESTVDGFVSSVERVLRALKGTPGSGVLLCTEYLPLDAYRQLSDAGLAGIVQWDETLDSAAYMRWHGSSPHKREFVLRMDNHDRAMVAGLDVATGALFGLADYRYDALMQVAKARHLSAEYGRGPFVFGTPRLKPIADHDLELKTSVSDLAYETALLVYRIAAPQTGRWLQTRETFGMNLRNLLDGDVFTYKCGDVTPGGHHQIDGAPAPLKRGQFGVNELERDYVERELAAQKFSINYRWLDKGVRSAA